MTLLDQDEFLRLSALVSALVTKLKLKHVINEEDYNEIFHMAFINVQEHKEGKHK